MGISRRLSPSIDPTRSIVKALGMIGKLSRLEGLKKIADMETGKETPKKKEFKVGEVFQCGLVKLRCEKKPQYCKPLRRCEYCFLVPNIRCNKLGGNCSSCTREDKTDVIFVKVED